MHLLNRRILLFLIISPLLFLGLKLTFEQKLSSDNFFYYRDDPKTIFSKLEEGFNKNEIKIFSDQFGKQIYLSLFNGVSGYYTSNQAFYVLKDFLNITRPENFSFTKIQDGENPYATGEFWYSSSGKRSKGKIYISLNAWGQSWRISQITIR